MTHFVYIIFSEKTDKYYVGSSHNPEIRLLLHNDGATRSTKSGIPWKLVYTEMLENKSMAIKREFEIKRKKSRKYIQELIAKG
jgi:putative endonuclease